MKFKLWPKLALLCSSWHEPHDSRHRLGTDSAESRKVTSHKVPAQTHTHKSCNTTLDICRLFTLLHTQSLYLNHTTRKSLQGTLLVRQKATLPPLNNITSHVLCVLFTILGYRKWVAEVRLLAFQRSLQHLLRVHLLPLHLHFNSRTQLVAQDDKSGVLRGAGSSALQPVTKAFLDDDALEIDQGGDGVREQLVASNTEGVDNNFICLQLLHFGLTRQKLPDMAPAVKVDLHTTDIVCTVHSIVGVNESRVVLNDSLLQPSPSQKLYILRAAHMPSWLCEPDCRSRCELSHAAEVHYAFSPDICLLQVHLCRLQHILSPIALQSFHWTTGC
eukprot:3511988-Amphidinium_carterae.1